MMNLEPGAITASPLVTLHRIFIATLASAAVLIGLVAMHSAGMVHSGSHSEIAATHAVNGNASEAASAIYAGHAGHAGHAGGQGLAGEAATHAHAESLATTPLLNCDERCATECAMMALSCMLLFVLATLLFVGRMPAVLHRRADRLRVLIFATPRATAHIYSPSLAVLSISRT